MSLDKIKAGLINDAPEIKPTDKLDTQEVGKTILGINKPRFTTESITRYKRDKEEGNKE